MKKLLAIVSFAAALVALPLSAAGAKQASSATPSKSKVLAAIAAIEKDPLGKQGLAAIQTVTLFAANSDEVQLEISDLTGSWLEETGNPNAKDGTKNPANILLGSYIAGYLKSQLNNETLSDYIHSGWLFVISTYKQLAAKTKLSCPSIERLADLESKGWLAEYAQVVVKEQTENAAAWNAKIPASKKLTRGYLSPARGLESKGKYDEAYALYKAWLAQNPGDAEAHFYYGYAMTLQANGENNENAAADLRKKARPHILMAAALGTKNPLLPTLLSSTAPDYKEGPYSENKKANDLITQAEKAFAQHRYNDSAKLYQEALKYEPDSYETTLYIGDAYFYDNKLTSAIEWFKKAIALDPNKETAHRYLADTLTKLGKRNEALDEYIAAVVAEPYAQFPSAMLERVAQGVNPLYKSSPLRDIPKLTVGLNASGKNLDIGIASKADKNDMTLEYVTARAVWIATESQKRFPNGVDRHYCAEEEAAGLRAFAAKVFELNDKKDTDASNYLAAAVAIKKLDEAGLLEAAIYLDHATNTIAQDYPAYREKHRDLLERYLREFWLGQTP